MELSIEEARVAPSTGKASGATSPVRRSSLDTTDVRPVGIYKLIKHMLYDTN